MRIAVFALISLFVFTAGAIAAEPGIFKADFENGVPFTWSASGGVDATYSTSASNPHSGKMCLVCTNNTPAGPNVYGRLRTSVQVLPDTEYELSVWVRGEGIAVDSNTGHFTDWNSYFLGIPTGTYGWKRISTRFHTKPDQSSLDLGLNISGRCKVLALDDLTLRPVGAALKEDGFDGSFVVSRKIIGHDADGGIEFAISNSGANAVSAVVTVNAGKNVIFKKRISVPRGDSEFSWTWNSGNAPFGPIVTTIKVVGAANKILASAEQTTEYVNPPQMAAIDRVAARMPEFDSIYEQCRAKGIPLDYPTTAKTLLEQFIPLERGDARNDALLWRAEFAAKDMNNILDSSIAEMKAYLADPSLAPDAVRYVTSKTSVDGVSFIADRKDDKGRRSRGPVFLVGYGAFHQVRKDMPLWPGYGVNLIQTAEFGARELFPAEDKVDMSYVNMLIKTLDDAAKYNVKVDFHLSPSLPEWAYIKWPHLRNGGVGFMGFCPDEPEAKQVLQHFLEVVLPLIKDKPALNSFCLSNEGALEHAKNCENTRKWFAEYLQDVHGSVSVMNKLYGTNYASFADVPVPANDAFDAPQFYDYSAYLMDRFASWHKWFGDEVRKLAPGISVHAKIRMHQVLDRQSICWGVDPERFGEVTDLNGNDCIFVGSSEGFCVPWLTQNISYDIQRSLVNKPVFNSENHPTLDRYTGYVAPEHFRTCLWQGAVHGQGATALWVWERTADPSNQWTGDFYCNVMDRPGCVEQVSRTCLDLNRFADEVTALENVPAPVAILFSNTSIMRNPDYLGALRRVYTALDFCGVRVGFISEKQLAAGQGSRYKMIVFPDATNVPKSVLDAALSIPSTTRIVALGQSLSKDPYNNAFPASQIDALRSRATLFDAKVDPKDIWPVLREQLNRSGAIPNVRVVDAAMGNPIYGVEWLTAEVKGKTVVNIVNLSTKMVDVKIIRDGVTVKAMNLLSLGARETVKTLKPAWPVLAELAQ